MWTQTIPLRLYCLHPQCLEKLALLDVFSVLLWAIELVWIETRNLRSGFSVGFSDFLVAAENGLLLTYFTLPELIFSQQIISI